MGSKIYLDAIEKGDAALIKVILNDAETCKDKSLNNEALMLAILSDKNDSHLEVINLILDHKSIIVSPANNNNEALRKALLINPNIVRTLLKVPSVYNKLKDSSKCKHLYVSLSTAAILDRTKIVCEVSAIIWPNSKYPSFVKENTELMQILEKKKIYFYWHHKLVADKLLDSVRRDPVNEINKFLGPKHFEKNAITQSNLDIIYEIEQPYGYSC